MFKTFIDGLMSVCASDADLKAWAQTHYRQTFTQLKGFREIDAFARELPAQVFHPFGGEIGETTLGGYSTQHSHEVIMELVFEEADPKEAFDKQCALLDIVPRAIARNRTLGGTVAECSVVEWRPNDPREHPIYMLAFKISAEYDLLTI